MGNPTVRNIDLSSEQFKYLDGANFMSQVLLDAIHNAKRRSATSVTLELSEVMAEEFRETFTEQLARVGFDEKYNLTREGRLLEDLIDLFN